MWGEIIKVANTQVFYNKCTVFPIIKVKFYRLFLGSGERVGDVASLENAVSPTKPQSKVIKHSFVRMGLFIVTPSVLVFVSLYVVLYFYMLEIRFHFVDFCFLL